MCSDRRRHRRHPAGVSPAARTQPARLAARPVSGAGTGSLNPPPPAPPPKRLSFDLAAVGPGFDLLG